MDHEDLVFGIVARGWVSLVAGCPVPGFVFWWEVFSELRAGLVKVGEGLVCGFGGSGDFGDRFSEVF